MYRMKFLQQLIYLILGTVILAGCSSLLPPPPTVTPSITNIIATPTPTLSPPPTIIPALTATQGVANLVVELVTETGQQPTTEANVLVYSNGQMVNLATFNGVYETELPSGNYDIGIIYPAYNYDRNFDYKYEYWYWLPPSLGKLRKDIKLVGGVTNTVTFTIPTESYLAAVVYTKSGLLAEKAYSVLIASRGQTVTQLPDIRAFRPIRFVLRAGVPYDVIIDYDGEELKQESIVLQDSIIEEVEFLLPYDEGSLNIVVHSGKTPLPDFAIVTIFDSAGNEVHIADFWPFVRDETYVVLQADMEYTVQVEYEGQPTQKREVLVSAGKTIDMIFTFHP